MKNSWPGDDVLKGTVINSETFLALTMSLEFILKILKYERSLFQNTKEKMDVKVFLLVTLPTISLQSVSQHSSTRNKNREGKVLGKR